jgi:hypothetical protein
MWGGFLDFYVRLSDGDWKVWFAQHNEHRIVISRIFFWLDFELFNGAGWFLICLNYLLAALATFVFYLFLDRAISGKKNSTVRQALGFFITSILFFWCQDENFTWGFQSQFFLAQTLPLCGLYCLYRSAEISNRSSIYFFSAVLLGIASAGTMANGVLGLPVLVCFAIVTKQPVSRVMLLLIVSALTLTAYFYNYHAIEHHGSLFNAFLTTPLDVLKFVVLYFGSPFYCILKLPAIAYSGGLSFIALLIVAAFRTFIARRTGPLHIALLLFVMYLVASACGVAGGRVLFGLETASGTSRYTTPVVMAWVAMLILYSEYFVDASLRLHKTLWVALAVFAVLMLPIQFKALKGRTSYLSDRKIAALAIALGAEDQKQIEAVHPSAKEVLASSKRPKEMQLSVFGMPFIQDAQRLIGTHVLLNTAHECDGKLDEITNLEGGGYVRAEGWIFDNHSQKIPDAVLFLDDTSRVIGYGFTGQRRKDLRDEVSKRLTDAGFKGYILKDRLSALKTVLSTSGECVFQATLKP